MLCGLLLAAGLLAGAAAIDNVRQPTDAVLWRKQGRGEEGEEGEKEKKKTTKKKERGTRSGKRKNKQRNCAQELISSYSSDI